jgi:CRP-like cAMP-binding protein
MITIMLSQITSLFDDARTVSLEKGQALFRVGDMVRSIHLTVSGQLALVRNTAAGTSLVLHRAGPEQVLAEASVYAPTYHCDGIAIEPSTLRALSVAVFRDRLTTDAKAMQAWFEHLASSLQGARTNAEIRTLRTVAERLDAWLDGERALPAKGQWQDLAYELGVTREALYRELGRRRTGSGSRLASSPK